MGRSDSSSSYSYSSSRSRSSSRSPARRRDKRSSSSSSSSDSSSAAPRRAQAAPRRGAADEPQKAVLHVRNLTRNVNEEHLREIFGNYGSIKNVELAVDALVQLPKGYAFIEFASVDLAKAAVQHMDGGQIDSNVVSVALAGSQRLDRIAEDRPADREAHVARQAGARA